MKRALVGLLALGIAALAAPASAAYPNGGIYTFSQGTAGKPGTFRTINSQLTRQGGSIFVTHFYNWRADKLLGLGAYRDVGVGFSAPVASRFMGVDAGFSLYAPPGVTFAPDAGWNVLYFPVGTPNVFTVTASAQNYESNYVFIDHPLANGKPDAVVMVQQLAALGPGAPPPRNVGVWYHTARQRWAIFHQDRSAPMQAGEQYDVLVQAKHTAGSVTVVADAGRIQGSAFRLPSGVGGRLIVTQNWAPRSVYNDHPIGVRLTGPLATNPFAPGVEAEWEIFNEDGAPMPAGAAFNVVHDPAPPTQ